MRSILASVVVLLAACVPKTAAEQAKAAGDSDRSGHIDGSLQPIGKGGEVAAAGNSNTQLHLKDVSGDTACVIYTEYKPVQHRDRSKDVEELRQSASSTIVVVGATDSLGKFQWPDQRAGVKGKLVEAKQINKPYQDGTGEWQDSYYVDFTIEWCPPMPAISRTTKFLTASMFKVGSKDGSLFVWRIKGTPVETAGAQPPAASTTTSTTTGTTGTSPEPSSKPATTSGNTVLDWLRKERYDRFLQIAAVAGVEQELTKGGVIVIAAYDNQFPTSTFDELVADKSRALAFMNDSIIDGTLTKQQLVDKQSVTLTTRGGKQVVLTYDGKKQRPFLDGARLDRKIVETSNGTIFIRDTMVR